MNTGPSFGGPGGGVGVGALPIPRDGAAAPEKNSLKPWQKQEWCIPKVSAEFVAHMEDVLDLYAQPYDPRRPVCFDETSTQLLADTRRFPKAQSPYGAAQGSIWQSRVVFDNLRYETFAAEARRVSAEPTCCPAPAVPNDRPSGGRRSSARA